MNMRVLDIERLLAGFDGFIPDREIVIVLDYPLRDAFEFRHRSEAGFTLVKVAQLIAQDYERVYATRESEGAYGVWGHDLDDLYLEDLSIHRRGGVAYVTPAIGS